MDRSEQHAFPHKPAASYALGIVTAIATAAGFAMVAAWFALLVLDDRRTAPREPGAQSRCNICGVVDRVGEVAPAPSQAFEGSSAEGTVKLIAALGGAPAAGRRPARIYETSVLQDDGSVRVLRDAGVPQWKPGDRVRVMRGRVEPGEFGAGVRQASAADAPAAAPAERTPIPALQAAQAW